MNGSFIDTICSTYEIKIQNIFRGVFAKNVFEDTYTEYCNDPKPNLCIVNSEKDNDIGSHWLLFLVSKDKHVFFDSYAYPLDHYNFKLPKTNWETTPFRVQHLGSNICGLYCIFVAFWLSLNKNLTPIILKHFSHDDLKQNDKYIIQFIKSRPYGEVLLNQNSYLGKDRAF